MNLLKRLMSSLTFKKTPEKTPEMLEQDKMAIGFLALLEAGEATTNPEVGQVLRQQAIDIYNRYLPTLGARGRVEMQYMSEVLNPVPDTILRAIYREEMVAFSQKRVNLLVKSIQ